MTRPAGTQDASPPAVPTVIRKILAPVDFSPASAEALRVAGDLARRQDAAVHVLHVLELSARLLPYGIPLSFEPDSSAVDDDTGRPLLSEFLTRVPAPHGVQRTASRTWGVPHVEILRVAEQSACDLIVMGTRRHGPLGRLFAGSVSRRVLDGARVPVVIVPHPPAARTAIETPISSWWDGDDTESASQTETHLQHPTRPRPQRLPSAG